MLIPLKIISEMIICKLKNPDVNSIASLSVAYMLNKKDVGQKK